MSIRIQSSLGMGVVIVSLWLALTTGSLAAGEDTPTGPVLALREKVEAAWNAVQKGDETTARITATEIVTRWERIPPVVKRLILRTHPELEEVMAGLPDEAASLAREYAALLPDEAESSKDQTPAETPAPAAQDAEETGEGMVRLNARLLPTNEKPTAAQAATLEKIVIMQRPDRKIVILDQEVKEGRTVVVEGTGKTLQLTRRFTDPANLTLVNPRPSDLEVRHPSQNQWTRVPAYSSATAKVPGGEEDALEIRSTPGCSLLIIKGGAVQSLITTDASAQPAYVKAGEPLHIVMSTPSLQTVTASTTGSPARTILLYPYYPVAYVAASVVPTASAAVEAIYIATPYTQTVTCTTANGQTVTTEVPMATSAAYVVDSPTAVAYADAANGTTTITGANGTTTVTHHGGGIAVQDGNTTKSVRAGTTTVTAPSGESATVGHLHAAAVTKDESGNITGVNYAGASAGVTSTGRAGAAATTVQANDLGSGQGTVEIHSDVVTAGGGECLGRRFRGRRVPYRYRNGDQQQHRHLKDRDRR